MEWNIFNNKYIYDWTSYKTIFVKLLYIPILMSYPKNEWY